MSQEKTVTLLAERRQITAGLIPMTVNRPNNTARLLSGAEPGGELSGYANVDSEEVRRLVSERELLELLEGELEALGWKKPFWE